jgi:hypothetical protein
MLPRRLVHSREEARSGMLGRDALFAECVYGCSPFALLIAMARDISSIDASRAITFMRWLCVSVDASMCRVNAAAAGVLRFAGMVEAFDIWFFVLALWLGTYSTDAVIREFDYRSTSK